MANIFDGIQYRVPKTTFANTFRNWDEDMWNEWEDCGNKISYTGRVQFRAKPVFEYVVIQHGTEMTTAKLTWRHTNKDTAMSKLATIMEQGHEVSICKREKASLTVSQILAERNVQFKSSVNDIWRAATHFNNNVIGSGTLLFRVRPDEYWTVTISQGIVHSDLIFDDPDDLAKYLTKYATTNNQASIAVKPMRYA